MARTRQVRRSQHLRPSCDTSPRFTSDARLTEVRTYLAAAAAAKLAEGVTREQLTPRELATLRLLADGKSNREIAKSLGIAERTVKTHLGDLFEKLGVTSRTEAVKAATRRGLVRLG